jgi:hypothetical protein
MAGDDDRRRHARAPAAASVSLEALELGGAALVGARLIDASPGGLFIELQGGASPPPLAARGTARVRSGGALLERPVRVVRVRWAGRERGRPVAPGLALAFDEPLPDGVGGRAL